MKIKPIYWVIIIACAIIIPLALVFVITRIVINPPSSWWWTGSVFIIQIVIGVISGVIYLIFRLQKIQTPKIKQDPKEAKQRAIIEKKYDEDNPDNFVPLDQSIIRTGEGTPKTSFLWLTGRGTEKNEKIDCIINLDEPKFEATWLTNKTDLNVQEAIRRMAQNPEQEIKEEKRIGIDEFGRPQTTILTRKVSPAEKKAEEEKKEAEEANIY